MKIFCSALIAAAFTADVHASIIPVGEEVQRFVPMISQLFAFTPVSRGNDDANGGFDFSGEEKLGDYPSAPAINTTLYVTITNGCETGYGVVPVLIPDITATVGASAVT